MRLSFLVAAASFLLLAIQVSVAFGRVLSQFRTGVISTEIAVDPFTGDLLVGHDFGVLPPQIVRFSQTGELLEHIPVPFRDYRIRGLDVLSVDTTIGDVSVPAGSILVTRMPGFLAVIDRDSYELLSNLSLGFTGHDEVSGGVFDSSKNLFYLSITAPGVIAFMDVSGNKARILGGFSTGIATWGTSEYQGNIFAAGFSSRDFMTISEVIEFSPSGELIRRATAGELGIPDSVGGIRQPITGIDIDPDTGHAWVIAGSGNVYELANVPDPVNVFHNATMIAIALSGWLRCQRFAR